MARSATHQSSASMSYGSDHYALYQSEGTGSRDIIPQALPSRSSSTYLNYAPTSQGDRRAQTHRSTAVSSLRSLNVRPPSPPSPDGRHGFWPFGRGSGISQSPGASFARLPTSYRPATYDSGYSYDAENSGLDRPLPSRHPAKSSRPKSIELVTPMVGR